MTAAVLLLASCALLIAVFGILLAGANVRGEHEDSDE